MSSAPVITIVDDDDSLRNSLSNLLRSVGFQVREFASADAFLGSSDVRETACLILDVRIPGMNGLELQQHIVAADWRRPIIFVTSHDDAAARTRALGAGAVAFLYKPFHEQELLDAINTALTRE